MKPNADDARRIANIHQAAFEPFVYPDGVALGDAVLQLDEGQPLGVGFHVYRMPAGMTTRGHRHNGHEQFLILEGSCMKATALCCGPAIWCSTRTGPSTIPSRRMAACWRCTLQDRKLR